MKNNEVKTTVKNRNARYFLDNIEIKRTVAERILKISNGTLFHQAFSNRETGAIESIILHLKDNGYKTLKKQTPVEGGDYNQVISINKSENLNIEKNSFPSKSHQKSPKQIKGWNSPEKMRKERDAALEVIERRISLEHGDGTIEKRPEIFKGSDDLPSKLEEFKSFAYVRIARAKSEHFKKYVGETMDYDKRTSADDYTSGPFGKIWKEQGESGFLTIIICCYGSQDARLLEQALIVKFDTRNGAFGYNIR